MTAIHNIFICARCDSAITAVGIETTCPECGLHLGGKVGLKNYQPPLTLDEQHLKLQNKELYIQAILDLPKEKCMAMLQDALHIIEMLPGKKIELSGMRFIVELAVRIGEIAKAYDSFLQVGGQHVPAIFQNIEDEKKTKEQPAPPLPSFSQEKSNEQSSNQQSGETT